MSLGSMRPTAPIALATMLASTLVAGEAHAGRTAHGTRASASLVHTGRVIKATLRRQLSRVTGGKIETLEGPVKLGVVEKGLFNSSNYLLSPGGKQVGE